MLTLKRLCLSFLLQHILYQIQLHRPSLDTCLELPVSLCHLVKQTMGICSKSDVLSDATCDDPPNTAALGEKLKPPDPPKNMRGKARPVPKAGTGQVPSSVPQARTTTCPQHNPPLYSLLLRGSSSAQLVQPQGGLFGDVWGQGKPWRPAWPWYHSSLRDGVGSRSRCTLSMAEPMGSRATSCHHCHCEDVTDTGGWSWQCPPTASLSTTALARA